MAKAKNDKKTEKIDELTADLQRVRADFENYRKRSEADKAAAYQHGQAAAISKLLPVIDNIERAISHLPNELQDNKWAQGVASLSKSLNKSLESMKVSRIDASWGSIFDPELHEAVQFDEEAEGETEVVAEELQAGYKLGDEVIRHSMVKATRK